MAPRACQGGFVSTREDPVSGLRWHDLRATAITRVGHEGGITAAQALAGHSEIATTMRYFKQDAAALRQAMERAEQTPPADAVTPDAAVKGEGA